ncbi:MAG: methyltransferase domain-containing protein [Chloroflexi bacterium]|nr:methyltransferase domain-containing protein [Chloroflexota bacterium]
MTGDETKIGTGESEAVLERAIAAWTSHMPWRVDLAEWKERRLWQENYQSDKLSEIRRHAGCLEGKKLLELGCGMGGLAVALQRDGALVTALDPNPDYCEITRLRGSRYGLQMEVVNSTGEDLPLASGSFEVVTCYDVLEHAESPQHLLRQIYRVLKPHGLAFVTVTNRYVLRDPHYHLRFVNWMPRTLAETYVAWRGRSKNEAGFRDRQTLSEMHYFTLGQFRRLAGQVGFDSWDIYGEPSFSRPSVSQPGMFRPQVPDSPRRLSMVNRARRHLTAGAFHFLLQRPG